MELYLIRHAQSQNNLAYSQNSNERVADPALTPVGGRQAALLTIVKCSGALSPKPSALHGNWGEQH